MRRVLIASFFAAALTVPALGQNDAKPAFSDYTVKVAPKRAKAIDFRNSPGASTFRTRLREALRGDVNFAGRYIIASWGCGTGCLSGAIIDAHNGRVYFPKELSAIAATFAETGYEEILTFRPDSRLLIISGILGSELEVDETIEEGAHYLEWAKGRLRLVKYIPARPR